MKILNRQMIEEVLSIPAVLEAIERGFVLYSQGRTVIPVPVTLHFEEPRGECHIKYGYVKKGDYYVIKVASGFYENPKFGIPSSNGLIILCDLFTGAPMAIFLDEGYLTDIRTAAAGCVAAKHLAPKNVSCIGIIGTGAQAVYQLKLLSNAVTCCNVMVWGRDQDKAHKFKEHPLLKDWDITVAKDVDQLAESANLIVTTTSSSKPLLFADQIRPGTHITAVGADDFNKQELDPEIFRKATIVAADSRDQCLQIGDTAYALRKGIIEITKIKELGEIISDKSLGRKAETDITIADLTGIAIQDLQIASLFV